jgi:hypothetical protein
MKQLRSLTLLLWAGLCTALPLTAATPLTFAVSNKGMHIRAGELGELILPAPALTTSKDDHKGQSPAVTVENATTLLARYPSGSTLRISINNDEITYSYADMPPEAIALRFTTRLPINLNRGGRYVLGDKSGEFPAAFSNQNIASATASQLDIIHPLGQGLHISTPESYHLLQDNRAWNWNIFAWIYVHNLSARRPSHQFSFKVSLLADQNPVDASLRFLVDRFGQSARVDFPEKVRDERELLTDVDRQHEILGTYTGPELDAYGGILGSREKYGLKKTGYFHTARISQRPDVQVFVTPEGNAFFQLAVCSVTRNNDFTIVKGRERIYEWLPAKDDPVWLTAWYDGNPESGIFSFHIANWIRKYQHPFSQEEWTGQAVKRLRAWGFNSIGPYSAFPRILPQLKELQFPTVGQLPTLDRKEGYYLPDRLGAHYVMDPFAPGIEKALDELFAKTIALDAKNPLIIGYFQGNEQHFEHIPQVVLAYKASEVPAKAGLVASLRHKYNADITAFNAAWDPPKSIATFDDIGDAQLFIRTDAAARDMREFLQLYLDSYYAMVRRVFKKHSPDHLLLGSRFTPRTANNEDVVRIAGKYNDVVSVNYYTYGIEKPFLRKIHEWSGGLPVILSEWFYSSTERGLGAHTEVANQEERALAYRNYVEQGASLGFVIGSQWFIYFDQVITGRHFEGFNGEAMNTGLVDVADRPYEQLVAAARTSNSRVYDIHFGNEPPFAWDDPRFSGQSGGESKVATIPRALPGLRFDTTTTNWPGRPAIQIGTDRLAIGTPNPDFNGDFRLCWDDEFLHMLIEVKDPTPNQNTRPPAKYWKGDCVELFIGSRNPDQGGSLQYSDRQILIGTGRDPGVHILNHPDDGHHCRVQVTRSVSADGYTVRAEIPWEVLGIQPRAEMEFLFDLALVNSDDGEVRLQQLVWNGTEHNAGDRGSWGRARLVVN